MENQSGEDYGDYRGQVDEYAGLYGSQKLHCSVPGNEADGGGSQSQKQQVPQPHRIAKAFQVQPEGKDPQGGDHEQDPVGEHPPGGQDGVPSPAADFFHQIGVKGPDHCCQNRQEISHRAEMEAGAVETDQADPGHGHQESDEEVPADGLPLLHEQVVHQGGEKRGHADDHPHIGGHGIGKGDVFQQIIEADAAEPGGGQGLFLVEGPFGQLVGTQHKKEHQPQHKPEEQNLQGSEAGKQDFGGYESGAPDDDGEQGQETAPGFCILQGDDSFKVV